MIQLCAIKIFSKSSLKVFVHFKLTNKNRNAATRNASMKILILRESPRHGPKKMFVIFFFSSSLLRADQWHAYNIAPSPLNVIIFSMIYNTLPAIYANVPFA